MPPASMLYQTLFSRIVNYQKSALSETQMTTSPGFGACPPQAGHRTGAGSVSPLLAPRRPH